jgi:hypothetical protein
MKQYAYRSAFPYSDPLNETVANYWTSLQGDAVCLNLPLHFHLIKNIFQNRNIKYIPLQDILVVFNKYYLTSENGSIRPGFY